MIHIELYDALHVKIITDNREYLSSIKDKFSGHVEGYLFNPMYKTGRWDGKIYLFNTNTKLLPYGLLLDLISFHKKDWKHLEITVDQEVKDLFKGKKLELVEELSFKPYDYQKECINSCLNTTKGIIVSATASGKSLQISYVLKTLFENNIIGKAILIVPSIGLVTQFYNDMKDYGIDVSNVGRVGDKLREFDKPLTISTWQSLKNCIEVMDQYDCVIVDEVHTCKAKILAEIVKAAVNAKYRLGFTGTMPFSELDQLQVKSYLGPVIKEFKSADLATKGYVSKCLIKLLNYHYASNPKGDYNEVKDSIFTNTNRISTIREIIGKSDGSILLLVGKVESEGVVLQKALEKHPSMKGRRIVFLSGRDGADVREEWRKETDGSDDVVLIATYGIFSTGISIKSLRHLILASPFKSKIRIIQSIGRILRLHADKIYGATVWDICDQVKYLKEHSLIRIKHYSKERFEMEEIDITEGDCL